MKKTKKALLAAIACSAALAAAFGLAACNKGDEGATTPPPVTPPAHDHVWSGWTVEETNKPTTEAGGKATRTCSGEGDCDAAAADKELVLPAFNDTDYTVRITKQSNCTEAGRLSYTLKNDDSIVLTVDTPINHGSHNYGEYVNTDPERHYKVCSYNSEHVVGDVHDEAGEDGACSVCGYKAEAPAHSHDWSAWVVEDDNKPTSDAAGKATRTCNNDDCDATAAEKEYELPELSSEEYSVNRVEVRVGVDGETTYRYNKNGVDVRITQVIPALPHVHVWDWTLADENKPTTEAGGKLTRACTGEGDCDATVEETEYPLPALNETDYTVVAKAATCMEEGEITYTYNQNDITAKITVATPIDPDAHTIESRAAVPATCVNSGTEAYWACTTCGKWFSDEEGNTQIEELTTIAQLEHSDITAVESDTKTVTTNSTAATLKSIAFTTIANTYQCSGCGRYFIGDDRTQTFTSIYQNSRNGILIDSNESYVYSASKKVTFIAPADGTYTFTLSANITMITYSTETVSNVVQSSKWVPTAANIERFFNTESAPTKNVTVIMDENDYICFTTAVQYFSVSYTVADELVYGENEVEVTLQNSTADTDLYYFIPAETKTYSISVPAGVNVTEISSGKSAHGGEYGSYFNFTAEEGKKIYFSFSSTTTGTKKATIGEPLYPVLTLAKPTTVTMEGQTVIGVELGEDIVAGKKYKITFSGGFVTLKINGAGYWWVKINGENTYDSMNANTSTSFYAGNATGTTVSGDKSWDYVLSMRESSITFTAEEGDVIYLAIQDKSLPEGASVADLILTVTEVEE